MAGWKAPTEEAMKWADTVVADAWKAKLHDIAKAARIFEVASLKPHDKTGASEPYARHAAHLLQVLQARVSVEAAESQRKTNRWLVWATWALAGVTAVLAIIAALHN